MRIDDDQLIDRIKEAIENLLDKAEDIEKTHTLLRNYIIQSINNFESIVVPFLIRQQRNIVLEVAITVLSPIQYV